MKHKFRMLALTLALCLPLAGPVAADQIDVPAGDYATVLKQIRPLAEQGNANAQVLLGDMYEQGQGVPQNFA